MSPEMSHDDVRAALAAEALGALEPEERAAVLRHVEGCPACAAELAELQEAAGALAWAAPARPRDAVECTRMRARLVARAAADRADAPAARTDGPAATPSPAIAGDAMRSDGRVGDPGQSDGRVGDAARSDGRVGDAARDVSVVSLPARRAGEMRGGGSRAGWLAAAASVAVLLAVGAYAWGQRGRADELARRLAAAEDARIGAEQAAAGRDSTLAALTGARVRVIELAATGGRAPGGRMFWDPSAHTWQFFGHDLPPLGAGREYQLWLITPGRRIGAGTFRPHADGSAHVASTFALPQDSLRAVAVTEEPAGGVTQPTGTPLIVGAESD